MESYIVNIYRRERDSDMIVIDKVGSADKQSFQTSEELFALLSADVSTDRRREGRKASDFNYRMAELPKENPLIRLGFFN